jgi:signal transduction histidine kinase
MPNDDDTLAAEQQHTQLLRSLLDIGVQLTRDPGIGGILPAIVKESMRLTGARYGAVAALGADGRIEEFLQRGLTPEQLAALPHLPEGKGLVGLVLSDQRPLRVARIADHPQSVGFPHPDVPMDAFLGVPMLHRSRLAGALYLAKEPGAKPFSRRDEDLIAGLASVAAIAIENTRLFAEETKRAETSSLLRDIAHRVRGSLETDEVLATTTEALGRAAGVDRCFIRLLDGDGLGPISHQWAGENARRLEETGNHLPVSDLAARTRSSQWSEDVDHDGRLHEPELGHHPAAAEAGARAALSAPLEWGEELMGVVTFHSDEPRSWSAPEVELLEAAAREVSVALHHAHAYDHAVRTAAKLREVDRMRRDLVSIVSHELRSPMTVIAGIADILKRRLEQTTPEARTELVDILGREARRLTRLVSQVLDVESLEHGGILLRKDTCDLAELARAAVTDAGVAERARVIIEPGDAVASLDGDKIKQVFLNLLSNAAKFAPEGSPITIVIAGAADDVQVAVEDAGPGIREEDVPRLFHMFSRLDNVGGQPGSGIGLYASKAIVERHGGAIWVESAGGRGSRFCFRIPR